jgi:D-sedoheptulose 7-phosphate isomerase
MRQTETALQETAITAEWFHSQIQRIGSCFDDLRSDEVAANLRRAAEELAQSLVFGGTVYWCGNGGSAADSQHLAAELVGRFGRPGRGWPSVALTADSSVLTAAGNDFGFSTVFERQVQALVRPGDVVVGISTSGRSQNVISAIREARAKGAVTLALTGPGESPLAEEAVLAIRAPGATTSDIQTCHIAIGHMLCEATIQIAESWEERDA